MVDDLQTSNKIPIEENGDRTILKMGWADKTARISKANADEARKFLDEIFKEGRKSGKTTKNVELMKTATLEDKITKRFRIEDRLNPRQIETYFSQSCNQLRQFA